MTENKSGGSRELSKKMASNADTKFGLGLRAAIASIPMVGGGASLLVEARLSALQIERIDSLLLRLAELEAKVSENHTEPPSERLLQAAAMAAYNATDQDRPRAFANVLFLEGVGDDQDEVLRRFLLEILETLSRYEIALLLKHVPGQSNLSNSNFAEQLLLLHERNPAIEDIKQFALDRLAAFRLIDLSEGAVEVTRVGRYLASAI